MVRKYTITIDADGTVDLDEYVQAIVHNLRQTDGISDASVEIENTGRNIMEVERILGDLSDEELEKLQESIDSYTEEK